MQRTAAKFLLVTALVLPGSALAQEVAGRVLIAVGDVAIERAGARIAATTGSEVRTGDTLRLGAKANAQLRLTDESLISLRPDTTFRLTEYAFQGRATEQQRASFNLVQGAVRTVTGAIGRLRQDNYAVTTPTSTIGIRGTHYTLAHGDSFQLPDGSRAPGGTYGAVTDGRISVTNQAGVTVFGADQYFRVESPTSAPVQLLAPPAMLSQAVSRTTAKPAATTPAQGAASSGSSSETRSTVAQTGLGGSSGGMGIAAAVSSPSLMVIPETTLINSFISNQTATSSGVPTTVQAGLSGTSFFRASGPFSIPSTCTNPPCGTVTSGEFTLGVNFTLGQASFVAAFKMSDNDILNVGVPFNVTIPITVSGGTATFNATVRRSDFPTQNGAFRCFGCPTSGVAGFLDSMSISGTISGGQANITLSGTDAGGTGSLSLTLAQQALPNSLGAAVVIPTSGGGANARSAAYWQVGVDGSQRLTSFGPSVGALSASVGSATNTITGSNAAAGNLVWGYWNSGASATDFNYVTYTTNSSQLIPWITGTATNTLPASLGSVTYTPVGSLVNAGSGVFNSGSLTADFVNQKMSISLNATHSGAGNTFQMNGSSGLSSLSGRFSAGFSSVTCSGPCSVGTPSGTFGGFFAGPSAEGAGVSFTAGFGSGTGVTGVAAFKR